MTVLEMGVAAGRRLWRRRSVSGTVFAALTIGIGLATSIFAVVDTILWRPLPLADPQSVVWIETLSASGPDGSSPGLLFAWRERARTAAAIAAIREANATFDDSAGIDRVPGAFVTASYFDVLGLAAAAGRTFAAELDRPGADPVVVLSDHAWRQRYAADAGIIGSAITFNGASRTVIGVMPPAFDELAQRYGWLAPLALADSQRGNVNTTYLDVIGRLRPGIGRAAAHRELAAIAAAIGARGDDGTVRGVRLTTFGSEAGRPHRSTLLLLLAAVLILFAITCANVAALQLSDGLHRRGEIAVRSSLGATRAQLVLQLGLEGLLVAACASGFGILLAQWFADALVFVLPASMPRLDLVQIDPAAVLFAVAAGMVSAAAGGVLPALRSTRVDVSSQLRARRDGSVRGHAGLRRVLVVGQVALTTLLVASGALLLLSSQALNQAPRGYDAAALTAAFTLPVHDFPTAAATEQAFDTLVRSVRAVPGVSRAAISTRVPLAGSGAGSDVARTDESFGDGVNRQVRIRLVSAGYFAAMRIPVVHGREIDDRDRRLAPAVVLVNETLARRLGEPATLVGTDLKFALREFNRPGGASTPWQIVGIVADTLDQGPRSAPPPEVFVPLTQAPQAVLGWMGSQAMLVVQGPGDIAKLAPEIRAAVAAAGLRIPLYDIRTAADRLRAHLARERAVAAILTALAAAGLALSCFGMFAVIHQLVRRQRPEMALRLAIGASPRALVARVVREALIMGSAGLLLGLGAFAAVAGALRPLLFGVGPGDPVALALVAVPLVGVTLAAAWLPARAAARTDPSLLLRGD